MTGCIPVAAGVGPGSTVALWVDDAGAPARVPQSEVELRGSAVVIGIGTMSGLSLAVVAALAEVGRRVERRAEALWEREWERVEPGWSGRAPSPPSGFVS
ncbi:hypothetical protein FB465_6539 [Kitasatospora atroaurantiaca]|uniref:Uncharacterized protein n=1 Tax=Kitasatospora atroaurantiaca TaxID=285545 RepID=A0A561F0H2_9ACTN|nr:hypothetical protein FB465_6539 [Kitasatospora atroaurantiaca]